MEEQIVAKRILFDSFEKKALLNPEARPHGMIARMKWFSETMMLGLEPERIIGRCWGTQRVYEADVLFVGCDGSLAAIASAVCKKYGIRLHVLPVGLKENYRTRFSILQASFSQGSLRDFIETAVKKRIPDNFEAIHKSFACLDKDIIWIDPRLSPELSNRFSDNYGMLYLKNISEADYSSSGMIRTSIDSNTLRRVIFPDPYVEDWVNVVFFKKIIISDKIPGSVSHHAPGDPGDRRHKNKSRVLLVGNARKDPLDRQRVVYDFAMESEAIDDFIAP